MVINNRKKSNGYNGTNGSAQNNNAKTPKKDIEEADFREIKDDEK